MQCKFLPIAMDKFWPSSSNKIQLQQIFIIWIQDIPVYLGGANREDITSCIQVSGCQTADKPHLKCFHEQVDDMLLFHVNHGVKMSNITKVVIGSPDTDIFVNATFHFDLWKYCNLRALWVVSGKSG